jgi:hypothetical protein
VATKARSFFVVVRLKDEEWLDKLIYPKVRSHSSSWVYLENEEQKKMWLANYVPPPPKNESERNMPSGIRFEVLRRDNFTCTYCGRAAPKVTLHVDHRVPWKVVKNHSIDNLVTACADCNLGKKDKII